MHACHTVQSVIATHYRQGSRQRPDRSTGIAHEKISLMHWKATLHALHRVILAFTFLLP